MFGPNTKVAGDATTLATLQLSLALGAVNCELAYVHTPASAFTLIGAAQVIVGF